MMVDLDSKESFQSFFTQVRFLGMTQSRHHYIAVTLVSSEIELKF